MRILEKKQLLLILIASLIFLVVMIAWVSWWYSQKEKQIRKTCFETLDSIAELKKNQIAAWRQERRGDIEVLSQLTRIKNFLKDQHLDDKELEILASYLNKILEIYNYDNIFLLNIKGEIVFNANKKYSSQLNKSTLKLFQEALKTKKTIFSSFYNCPVHQTDQIDLVAPVLIRKNLKDEVAGAIVCIIDPNKFLYPLIKFWPTPSPSAETLLVQQQDDKMIFFTARHSKGKPLPLILPLTAPELSATRFIKTQAKELEGRDYRGEPVLSVGRIIPDSPWILGAKIDVAEVYQPLYREAGMMAMGIILLLFLGGTIIGWWFTAQEKRHHQVSYLVAKEKQALYTASQVFLEQTGVVETLTQACRCAVEQFKLKLAWVGLVTKTDYLVQPIAIWGEDAEYLDRITVNWGPDSSNSQNPCVQSIRSRQAVVTNRLSTNSVFAPWQEAALARGIKSLACLPMLIGDEIIGIISLCNGAPDYFTSDRIITLQAFANLVAGAFQKARLYEASQGYAMDLEEQVTARTLELETEKKLSDNIINCLPGIFALFDEHGRLIRWNANLEHVGGYNQKALSQHSPVDFFVEEDKVLGKQALQQLFQDGKVEFEGLMQAKDGSPVPYFLTGHRIDHNGVPCMIGLGIDISQRKKAELALQESESRFRTIFEKAADPILVADIATQKFIMANEMASKLLGYSIDKICQLEVMDLHPPEALPYVQEQFELHALQKISLALDVPMQRSDGSIWYAEVNAFPIKMRGIAYLMGIFRDITERKKNQDELVNIRDRLEMTLKSANLGTWEWNIKTGELIINEQCAAMVGYRLEEIKPTAEFWIKLLHPEDLPPVQTALSEHLEGKNTFYRKEYRLRHKSGKSVWVLDMGKVTEWDAEGKPLRACGIHQDITEIKQVEKEKLLLNPNPVIELDLHGAITFCNEGAVKACRRLGVELVADLLPQDLLFILQEINNKDESEFYREVEVKGTVFEERIYYSKQLQMICLFAIDITEQKKAEGALRESEKKFRLAFENAQDAILWANAKTGIIINCNNSAEKLFEKPKEKLVGIHQACLHPPAKSIFYKNMFKDQTGGNRSGAEAEIVTGTGEIKTVTIATSTTEVAGHAVIQGIFRDISASKKMEEELRKTNRFIQNVFNSLPVHLVVIDEKGDILYHNDNWDNFGRANGLPASYAYHNYLSVCDEAQGDCSAEAAPVAAGLRRLLAGQIDHFAMEYPCHSPDAQRYFRMQATKFTGSGPILAIIVHENITERWLALEALRQSEERHHLAQDFAQAGTWEWDLRTDENFWSEELWKLYELNPQTCKPSFESWLQTIHPDDRQSVANLVREAAGNGSELNAEWRRNDVSGNECWLMARGRPVKDNQGNIIRYLGIVMDITSRKKTENALREALVEKVVLLKEVHHRVKNNLQIVASLLNLQMNKNHDQHLTDSFMDAQSRIRSMALLHEMLYQSKNLAKINFTSYIEELGNQLLRSFAKQADAVTLEYHIAPLELPVEESINCGLIINELVSNSLKHGFPDGRPGKVIIDLGFNEEQKLQLRVYDNGIGLPTDFNIADKSTLGLQLVSNLATHLGVELKIEPLDTGVSFSLLFSVPEQTCEANNA